MQLQPEDIGLLSTEEFATLFGRTIAGLSGDFKFSYSQEPSTGIRMSGIAKCARQSYYDKVSPSTEGGASSWQSIMGYAGQEIVAATLIEMGYDLFNQEQEVYYAGIKGHTDGQLRGLDLDGRTAVWDCKLRNSFALKDLIMRGLPAASPEMYAQQQAYLAATGADLCIITVHPFDLTDARSRLKQYKIPNDPMVNRVVLEPDPDAFEWIEERVDMLEIAVETDMLPAREYDPERGSFPCGKYCPHSERCLMDGDDKSFVVSPVPWKVE